MIKQFYFYQKMSKKNMRNIFFWNFQNSKIFKKKLTILFLISFQKDQILCIQSSSVWDAEANVFETKTTSTAPKFRTPHVKHFFSYCYSSSKILYALDLWNRLELDAHIFTQGKC